MQLHWNGTEVHKRDILNLREQNKKPKKPKSQKPTKQNRLTESHTKSAGLGFVSAVSFLAGRKPSLWACFFGCAHTSTYFTGLQWAHSYKGTAWYLQGSSLNCTVAMLIEYSLHKNNFPATDTWGSLDPNTLRTFAGSLSLAWLGSALSSYSFCLSCSRRCLLLSCHNDAHAQLHGAFTIS